MSMSLLEIRDVRKVFHLDAGLFGKKRNVYAVDGVSFTIEEGETLGVVGESGCGKSTLGRTLLRLIEPTSGEARFNGEDLFALKGNALKDARRSLQMIFQDPFASLNPRMKIGDVVGEPFIIHNLAHGRELKEKVLGLLEKVGLRPEAYDKYPHEFSGGQRQRIGIARALAVVPKLIVADEPVSALDVSIQAQVLNLLMDLQDEFRLSYLFIAHDLRVVEHIAHRVAVMYLGRIVELAPVGPIYKDPRHPYTEALLSAIPRVTATERRKRIVLRGDVPSPINPPSGCPFHPRCPYAQARCAVDIPPLLELEPGRWVACHFPVGTPAQVPKNPERTGSHQS
jgi:oligopeptide/dipeptide ABC transporter ATP-binding protein